MTEEKVKEYRGARGWREARKDLWAIHQQIRHQEASQKHNVRRLSLRELSVDSNKLMSTSISKTSLDNLILLAQISNALVPPNGNCANFASQSERYYLREIRNRTRLFVNAFGQGYGAGIDKVRSSLR